MSYFKFFCENQTKQINDYMLMSLDNRLSITAGKELQLRWFDYPISNSCRNFPNDKWKLCWNFNTLKIKQLEINVIGTYTCHWRILKNYISLNKTLLEIWILKAQLPVRALVEVRSILEKSRIGHRTTEWFQIGKGVHQGYILLPCLFNFYAEYIMRNSGLEEKHKLESRLPGEMSITSDM